MEETSSVNASTNVVRQQSDDGEEFYRHYPPGYRFEPYDNELISCYLLPMIEGKPLPPNLMHHVNVYDSHPEDLAGRYKAQGNNIWYFFTPRDKKYPGGGRPSRSARDGFWKATGSQGLIWDEHDPEKIIGKRRGLVFYRGDTKNHLKTNWMIHEYWIENAASLIGMRRHDEDVGTDVTMRLDPYVLCKIYRNDREKVKEDGKKVKKTRVKPAKKAHTKRKRGRKISSDDTPTSINQEISPNNNNNNVVVPPLAINPPSSTNGWASNSLQLHNNQQWTNINTTTNNNNNIATNMVSLPQNIELTFNANYTYFQNTNNNNTNCVILPQNNELPFNTNYTYFQNTNNNTTNCVSLPQNNELLCNTNYYNCFENTNNNTINTTDWVSGTYVANSYSGDWNSNTAVVSSYNNNNINVGNLDDVRINDNISLVPEPYYDNDVYGYLNHQPPLLNHSSFTELLAMMGDNNKNNEVYLMPELLDMNVNNDMDYNSTMFLQPLSENNNTTSDQNKLKPPDKARF